MGDLTTQIRSSLQAQSLPLPSQTWLAPLITARTPPPPLQSLLATAKARLLAADLTSPCLLDVSTPALPPDLSNVNIKEIKLPRDVVVQVLDVENLSRSRWEQVEELEAIERGEQTRGRQIVRLPVRSEGDEGDTDLGAEEATQAPTGAVPGLAAGASNVPVKPKNATHRLTLQDWRGQRVYGIELKPVDRVAVGITNIGEKVLLRAGSVVARGSILLQPATCLILGGKVEAWQRAWVEGRMARLKESVGADRPV